jgi:hypothetical protein
MIFISTKRKERELKREKLRGKKWIDFEKQKKVPHINRSIAFNWF